MFSSQPRSHDAPPVHSLKRDFNSFLYDQDENKQSSGKLRRLCSAMVLHYRRVSL